MSTDEMAFISETWDQDAAVGPDNFASNYPSGLLCACQRPYFRKTGPDAWEMAFMLIFDRNATIDPYTASTLPEVGWVGANYDTTFGGSNRHTWEEFQAIVAGMNANSVPSTLRMGIAWGMLVFWPLAPSQKGTYFFDITDGNTATACAGGPLTIEWSEYTPGVGPLVFGKASGNALSTTGIGYTKFANDPNPMVPKAYSTTMFTMRVSFTNGVPSDTLIPTGLSTVTRWVCTPGTNVKNAINSGNTTAYEFAGSQPWSTIVGILEIPRLTGSDVSKTDRLHSGPAWYVDDASCVPTKDVYNKLDCCAS
jgi:hypothetical protein